jgi:hypothetical protein
MATDRITKIIVRFENEGGSEVLVREYVVDPMTSTIKASQPQGKCPGYVEVRGYVMNQEDHHGGQQS